MSTPGAKARTDALASGWIGSGDGDRSTNTGLRAHPDCRNPAKTAPGGHGNRAGTVPAVLLLKVFRTAQYGSDGDELRLLGVQNRGSPSAHSGRHQRVPPHQTGPRTEAPDTDDPGSALYQSEVTGDKSGKTSSQRAGILRPREASSQADCHVPEVPGAGKASKHDADGVEFYE